MLKRQCPIFCSTPEQQEFSTSSKRQRQPHSWGVERFNLAWLVDTNATHLLIWKGCCIYCTVSTLGWMAFLTHYSVCWQIPTQTMPFPPGTPQQWSSTPQQRPQCHVTSALYSHICLQATSTKVVTSFPSTIPLLFWFFLNKKSTFSLLTNLPVSGPAARRHYNSYTLCNDRHWLGYGKKNWTVLHM